MLGFRPGRRQALLAGLAETVGGLLLVLGFMTPLGAAAVISVMLVAVFRVHIQRGFFVHNGGYEYNLVLAIAVLTLAFTGPAFSVGRRLSQLRLQRRSLGVGSIPCRHCRRYSPASRAKDLTDHRCEHREGASLVTPALG